MERLKYISLVKELRQIVVARALNLLNEKDDAEDVAREVMLKLWERHQNLHDNAEEVRHLADTMATMMPLINGFRHHRLCQRSHRRHRDTKNGLRHQMSAMKNFCFCKT